MYTQEGGGMYEKIHPATYVALLIFIHIILQRTPSNFIRDQHQKQPGLLLFFISIILIAAVGIVSFGTAGMAYLLETFIVAAIYLMFLSYLSVDQKNSLAQSIIYFTAANSAIGLIEYGFGRNLIENIDDFGFFRSSALLGHPLSNALITATVCIFVVKMQWGLIKKITVMSLMLLSLFAFGARGALGMLTLSICFILLIGVFLQKNGKRRKLSLIVKAYSAVPVVVLIFIGLLFFTELGDSIASRLGQDSSIDTRFDSFELLSNFSLLQILWGVDSDTFTYLTKYLYKVDIVENFWVVLILRIGLPMLILLVVTLANLIYNIVRNGNWIDILASVLFLLVASTNNSLTTKSVALTIYLLMASCTNKLNAFETKK
jgi:hypothetical protein